MRNGQAPLPQRQRRILAVRPLAHRAVVHADRRLPDQRQGEGSVRRTDPALSVDVDRRLRRDAEPGRQRAQLARVLERVVVVD